MSSEPICANCGGPVAMRNPTGNCDHLQFPDYLTPEAKAKVANARAEPHPIEATGSGGRLMTDHVICPACAHNFAAVSDASRERIAELSEALEWYGEQARLCRLVHSEGDVGRYALNHDGGKRARDVLQKTSLAMGSRAQLHWQDERTDDGARSRVLLTYGAVAGSVLQFPDNAPTTYANARGARLGAFESWEAAISAVEKANQ